MRSIFISLLMTLPAAAQEVRDCDELASVASIAEPWADNTRTFANDRVRLVVIDTLEPAAAAFHLVVLSPPYDAVGDRQCKMVSLAETLGFAGLSLSRLTSSYDPALGLKWQMDATVFDPNSSDFMQRILNVTINQSSGEITAELP